jgi:uncharacterized phosphosugar-binding protein
VENAADLVTNALLNGGAVYCAAIGHGNENDFIQRAGGLAAVNPFTFNSVVTSPTAECLKDRPRETECECDIETVRLAVRSSNLRAGDVIMIGSVSGRNRTPVELAMACREIGVRVIGLTSLDYTSRVESCHPSGNRLCDVSDVVIDNGAPYGDAAVRIVGYNSEVLPVSGVSMIVIGWMVWGLVMEKMARAEKPATVFVSVNREGGQEMLEKSLARFNERGY